MSTETVTLKLVVEHAQKATGDVHAVVLARPPTYAALQTAACCALGAAEVKLRYVDDDGDRIVLASQYDLDTALALAAPGTRLRVLAEVVSALPSEPPRTEQPQQPQEEEQKQQKQIPAETTPLETLLAQLGSAAGLETVLGGMLERLAQHLAQHEAAEAPAGDDGTRTAATRECGEAGVYGQVAHTLPATVVHRGVACDGCGAAPIRGMRYKCACCADYDLCQECVRTARARHDAQHVFVPLALPLSSVQVVPLMRLVRAAAAATAAQEDKKKEHQEEVQMTPAEREAVARLEEMGFMDVRRNLAYLRRFNGTICEQLVECLARLTAEDHK